MSLITDQRHPGAVGWSPVRLRSVFQPFASRIDLGPGTVELWLPVYFGRRRPFAVPLVAVAVAELHGAVDDAPRGVFDAAALTIPYLSTSGQVGEPNLLLLFAEPQQLPRIGWRGWAGLPGVPVRQVNGPAGWYVDGVALQVRDDVAHAVAALVDAGAEEIDSLDSWAARNRPDRVSPEGVASRRRAEEEARTAYDAIQPAVVRGALFGFAGVIAGAGAWAALAVLFELQAFLVAIGAGLLIAWLVGLGGRRLTPVLQAVIVVETLSTVVLGEFLAFLATGWQTGARPGVFEAADLYLRQLDVLGTDLVFALLAGVVGAAGGIGWAHQRADTVRVGAADAGTTTDVARDAAPAPLSATRPPTGAPPTSTRWARRGGQLVVVGAVLGGLYLTVTGDIDDDERNAAGEPSGVPASELRVGDCLDEPSGTEFEFVDVLPCDQPHDVEIFHRFDIPLDRATDFPGDDVLVEYLDGCLPTFDRFVGVPFERSALDVVGFWPAADVWAFGDREMLCGVMAMDGTKLEGTVRGSRR
jgi:hypothetical protein